MKQQTFDIWSSRSSDIGSNSPPPFSIVGDLTLSTSITAAILMFVFLPYEGSCLLYISFYTGDVTVSLEDVVDQVTAIIIFIFSYRSVISTLS